MRIICGKWNIILCGHPGPGAQKKSCQIIVSSNAVIISQYRILIIGSVSQRIILPVGKEIGQMFFREIVGSFFLRKKRGFHDCCHAKCPAGSKRILILHRCHKAQRSGIIRFRISGVCVSISRVYRCQIAFHFRSCIQWCQVSDWFQLRFSFFFCQRTAFYVSNAFCILIRIFVRIFIRICFFPVPKAFCNNRRIAGCKLFSDLFPT